jgi:hypothetical protein
MVKIGAIFYVAWGRLHLYAAFQVYKLGSRQMAGMVQGRIFQSVKIWLNGLVTAITLSGSHHL